MRRLITRNPPRVLPVAIVASVALALAISLVAHIVLANPETWYLRPAAGATCGPGDLESLNLTAGTTSTTKLLDGAGDTWSRAEPSARSLASGNWQVLFDASTGSGGGPANKTRVLVERRSSACTIQQTIISEDVAMTKGVTQEYATLLTDPRGVSFAPGDVLAVSLIQISGNQAVTLRYDGSAGGDADSRLAHPEEQVVVAVTDVARLTEAAVTGLGFPRTDGRTLADSIRGSLGVGISDTSAILEAVASVAGKGFFETDVATLTDLISRGLGFTRAETASLAEAIEAIQGKRLFDVIAVVDVVVRPTSGNLSRRDAATLLESMAAAVGIGNTEMAALLESIRTAPRLGLPETATLLDFVSVVTGGNFLVQDVAQLLDLIAAALQTTRTEGAVLGDSLDILLGRVLVDTSSILESIAVVTAQTFSRTDTAALFDAIGSAFGLGHAEAAAIAESIRGGLGVGGSERTTLLDSLAVLAGRGFVGGDLAEVVESVAAVLDFPRTDNSALSESLQSAFGLRDSEAARLLEFVVSLTTAGSLVSDTLGIGDLIVAASALSETDRAFLSHFVQSAFGFGTLDAAAVLGDAAAVGLFQRDPATLQALVAAALLPTDAAGVAESVRSDSGVAASEVAASIGESVGGASNRDNRFDVTFSDSVAVALATLGDVVVVTKVDSPDPVLVGDALTYELVVTNISPSVATGIILTDTLPEGVLFGTARASQGKCRHSSGTVTCELGSIGGGAEVLVTVSVTPGVASGGTTIANAASVVANESSPTAPVSRASQGTTVREKADLVVEALPPPNGVIAGEQLTFEVTVTNNGPSDASGVALTEVLPAEAALLSVSSGQGVCGEVSGTVSCDIGTVSGGSSVTIATVATVLVALDPGETRRITGSVNVVAGEADPDESNNTVDIVTDVYTDADGDGIGDGVEAGAANGGDADVDGTPDLAQDNVTSLKNVVDQRYVTLKSPQGTVLSGVRALDNPSPGDRPAGVDFPVGFLEYDVTQVAPGSSVTVDLFLPEGTIVEGYWKYGPTLDNPVPHWYAFPFDGTTGAVLSGNRVTLHLVDGLRGDDDLTANGDIVDPGAPVFAPADLLVSMTGFPDPVLVGNRVTYTIDAGNEGPSNANGVNLEATLPTHAAFSSAVPSQGTCRQLSGTVSCDLGTMDSGFGAEVTISLVPRAAAAGATITNTVTIEANETDSDSTNNNVSRAIAVNPSSDLSVTIRDFPDPANVGDVITYAVTVANRGPSQATGVVLTHTMPSSVAFVSATMSQGNCSQGAGTVTCSLGALDSGASATVAVVVVPTASAGGIVVTNTALVTANEVDPSTENNNAQESTAVKAPAPPPTPTPGPSPTPLPPLTVVPEEEITVAGAEEGCVTAVVHPTTSTVLVLPEHGVSFRIPEAVQQRTFQVNFCALATDSVPGQPEGRVLAAVSIAALDVDASPIPVVELWSPARLAVTLTDKALQDMGGLSAALSEHAAGRLALQRYRPLAPTGYWTALRTQFDLIERSLSTSLNRLGQPSIYTVVWSAIQPALPPSPEPTPTATPTATMAPTSSPVPTPAGQPTSTPAPGVLPTATSPPLPVPTATPSPTPTPSVAPLTEPTLAPVPTTTSAPTATAGLVSPVPTSTMVSALKPTPIPATPPRGGIGPLGIVLLAGLGAAVMSAAGVVGYRLGRRGSTG